MPGRVCIDASVALMLLIDEDSSARARSLWQFWLREEVQIVTPPLFFAEVTSVLRERVHFRRLEPELAEAAFHAFMEMGIMSIEAPNLQPLAWELSKKYERPRSYDAQYLAVASLLSCDVWTADRRLVNAVNERWVRWVGEHEVTS